MSGRICLTCGGTGVIKREGSTKGERCPDCQSGVVAPKPGYEKLLDPTPKGNQEQFRHGIYCEKKPHIGKVGYLHDEDDDSPYRVGGQKYCGRCHVGL